MLISRRHVVFLHIIDRWRLFILIFKCRREGPRRIEIRQIILLRRTHRIEVLDSDANRAPMRAPVRWPLVLGAHAVFHPGDAFLALVAAHVNGIILRITNGPLLFGWPVSAQVGCVAGLVDQIVHRMSLVSSSAARLADHEIRLRVYVILVVDHLRLRRITLLKLVLVYFNIIWWIAQINDLQGRDLLGALWRLNSGGYVFGRFLGRQLVLNWHCR